MLVSPRALEGNEENKPNFCLKDSQRFFLLFGRLFDSSQVFGSQGLSGLHVSVHNRFFF